MCWMWCWDAITNVRQNRPTLPSWRRLLCYRYSIWNDLPHEFIDKAIYPVISKETSIVCCCSWWTFWTFSLNREGSWQSSPKCLNCWRRSCAKFDSLLLNTWDATACSLEKLNFKVLNCCIYWTTSVILIKFAVAWILVCVGPKSATIPEIYNFS